MGWLLFSMGLAAYPASAMNNPLMSGIFFRIEREVLRTFGPCDKVSGPDEPVTAKCHAKVYGRDSETIFAFDDTHHVRAVLLAFPPVPSLDDAQGVMKTTVGALSGQFGPPNVQRNDVGATWSWTNEHGVATVKLMKVGDELWMVTATLKEGHLPQRWSQ